MKEKDEDLVKHITKIEYKTNDESNDFALVFHFSANDFIENESLVKKFFFKSNTEEEPHKSEGTEVKWKKDKNLTKKLIKKTQKNKKSGAKRVI